MGRSCSCRSCLQARCCCDCTQAAAGSTQARASGCCVPPAAPPTPPLLHPPLPPQVMWEVLTWQLPWAALNPWQIANLVISGGRLDLPPRDQLPGADTARWGGLDAYMVLMQRCWAQEAAAQPAFSEAAADLRHMLADCPAD